MKLKAKTREISSMYADFQAYIANLIFNPEILENDNLIKAAISLIKAYITDLDKSITTWSGKLIDKELPVVIAEKERKLKRLGFKRQKKETDNLNEYKVDMAANFALVNQKILTYCKDYFKMVATTEDKINASLHFLQASDVSKIPNQRKSEYYQKVDRIVKSGLSTFRRLTKAGDPYRASKTRGEIEREVMCLLKDLFGEVDFLAINDRNYNPRKYVKMLTRTKMREYANKATVQTCREWECDLVIVSQHANPCPICAPYEGQIYSLSGRHPTYPILDLGWQHPNCMHGIDAYSEVVSGLAA